MNQMTINEQILNQIESRLEFIRGDTAICDAMMNLKWLPKNPFEGNKAKIFYPDGVRCATIHANYNIIIDPGKVADLFSNATKDIIFLLNTIRQLQEEMKSK